MPLPEAPWAVDEEEPHPTALCATTDPLLVLTHIPLLKVPARAVNAHGRPGVGGPRASRK